jgi:hypothetical protein
MIFVTPLLNKIIKIPYASIDAEAGAQPPFKKNVAKIGTIQWIVMVVIYVNNLVIFEIFLAIF